MEWVCTSCDRTYHEPPEECPVCGSGAVVPAEGRGESRVDSLLANVRGALTDPATVDRSLVRPESTVSLVFRLLVLASVLLAGALLLGLA